VTRIVHEGQNPKWKPSDFNWWLTQRYRHAPLIADNLYLAAQGTSVNWLVLAVLGSVKTHYFKMEKIDAFCIGEAGPDYELQADLAPAHWDHRTSIEEVLKEPELLYAYDTVYTAASRFLDGMAERREGSRVEPLPVPPPPPKPLPPKPAKPQEPVTPPTIPVPDNSTPETKAPGWSGVVLPVISAIIGLVAGAIGPWGALLKAVWAVIKSLIGG